MANYNEGREGELLFAQIMKDKGYTVQDVSKNPNYWDKDIDFIITSPTSGKTKTFEVKWDSRINTTGNLYLELTNIHSKQWNYEGWYKHCKADVLVYGDAIAKQFYIIPFQALQERVSTLPRRVARCGGDSEGLLVRLQDITDIIYLL